MRLIMPLMSALALTILATPAGAQSPCGTALPKIGQVTPRSVDGAIVYATSVLNVDADGAPNSYLVDGKGLSFTCDGVAAIENGKQVPAGSPGWEQKCRAAWQHAKATGDYSGVKIFGFAAGEANRPLVQGAGDPLPGTGFISTTAFSVPGTPSNTQRHYIDAVAIPYIVLPGAFATRHDVGGGDVAVAFYPHTGKVANAVLGDTGGALDEASVALHRQLGSEPVVQMHGVARAKARIETGKGNQRVAIVVFPGKRAALSTNAAATTAAIEAKAKEVFQAWGGLDRLKACSD